jgi:hypothetical protein
MDEGAEAELQEQMEIAADAIRTAALELLQAGRVHPHVLVLAAARVAGELGAGMALAGGIPVEGRCWVVWPRSCATPGRTTPRRYGR